MSGYDAHTTSVQANLFPLFSVPSSLWNYSQFLGYVSIVCIMNTVRLLSHSRLLLFRPAELSFWVVVLIELAEPSVLAGGRFLCGSDLPPAPIITPVSW